MSGATVGMARPPMGPGMGGGMEPPVVGDAGDIGLPRKKKKKVVDVTAASKPGKPPVGKPKPVPSDPMAEIMGGAKPVQRKKEMV